MKTLESGYSLLLWNKRTTKLVFNLKHEIFDGIG